jgi:hypothetical protein
LGCHSRLRSAGDYLAFTSPSALMMFTQLTDICTRQLPSKIGGFLAVAD